VTVMESGMVIDRIMAVADEGVSWGEERKDRGGDSHVSQKRRDVGHPQHPEEVGCLGLHLGAVSLTRKQRGEMAEAAFLAKAAGLGFRVAKP
jgi:hypothetical protein